MADTRAEDTLQPWGTPPSLTSVPEGSSGPVPPAVRAAGGMAPLNPTPSPGGGGVAPGFLRTVPPVLEVKPPSGVDFNVPGNLVAQTTALTTPAIVVGGCAFTVPDGSVAYVRSFVLQVQNLLPTSAITFSLRVDGAAVPGWDNIFVLPSNLATWIATYGPDETFLEVRPGKTVSIFVTIADAGVYSLGASMHGWTVAQQTADAFAEGWS